MSSRTKKELLRRALRENAGVLPLLPAWVPRDFISPGGRMKLAPGDLYAFGAQRGGIDERWLASVTRADNGPETLPDEGMSYCLLGSGGGRERLLLAEAFELLPDELLGAPLIAAGGWTVLGKIFDNLDPLPVHLHPIEADAALVGRHAKPEAYYFPAELNLAEGRFPYTCFGLKPGTTKDDVKRCLADWRRGESAILNYTVAYRTSPGLAYNVPAGILHRPGTLVTYEPQRDSDVCIIFESMIGGRPAPWRLVTKDIPPEHREDLDYIVDRIDWEANLDPDFLAKNTLVPLPAREPEETRSSGFREMRIIYGQSDFAANEVRLPPGERVTVRDEIPYAMLAVAGHGRVGNVPIETPAVIRFGEPAGDEVFVSFEAARAGLAIENLSTTSELVLLKHFRPLRASG
ncbi:MAG: hypothetical protein V2A58_02020 [Planctomycetota bacterium]